ncbi:MAG: argininosuccinate lyase [Clostridia bacterium]|jgi:argininosuccinate lyase|nr:argininosuccinate lyase [Clostridiales bacterium]
MKLWAGRFTKDTKKEMDDFHSSISFDMRLYRQDILGSIAHSEALLKCGIITQEEYTKIREGLEGILGDIEKGTIHFDDGLEDIHMNIEKLLTDRIGETGKKLHTARSRNDQVAADLKMYLREMIEDLELSIAGLLKTLADLAEQNLGTIMPGYTHLQHAQPVTLAHHLMAYFEMFKRDMGRLKDCRQRMDESPLGSCALAGTTYPLDRGLTASLLGFNGFTSNSLDSVSDRDYAVEFLAASSVIMMHLSRFCEELILWSSSEFGFVEMDDAYSTGSSIMPQKKNPDAAELIRGKVGRVYGNLIGLLTVMKGLPLAYNKDMQEDKESVFDTVDTLKGCLSVFVPMLATLKFNNTAMYKAVSSGFTNATDVADYLAKKGVPFRTAHRMVGELVQSCIQRGLSLDELSLADYKKVSPVFEEDILDAIKPENCVKARNTPGGPAPQQVKKHIEKSRGFLAEILKNE